MHYVYYLLDPDTHELLYIGRSNNPKHRLYAFIKKKKRNAILGVSQRFSDFEKACKATAHSFGGFAGGAIITKTQTGSTIEQY